MKRWKVIRKEEEEGIRVKVSSLVNTFSKLNFLHCSFVTESCNRILHLILWEAGQRFCHQQPWGIDLLLTLHTYWIQRSDHNSKIFQIHITWDFSYIKYFCIDLALKLLFCQIQSMIWHNDMINWRNLSMSIAFSEYVKF